MYEIDIFVDIKSPLSYLILPQALQMMEDYHCIVTFKPYNLSYVDMGLTTSHDRNNPKRLPPNEGQTRRAKMYYKVGRIYAKAMGLEIKAPKKGILITKSGYQELIQNKMVEFRNNRRRR